MKNWLIGILFLACSILGICWWHSNFKLAISEGIILSLKEQNTSLKKEMEFRDAKKKEQHPPKRIAGTQFLAEFPSTNFMMASLAFRVRISDSSRGQNSDLGNRLFKKLCAIDGIQNVLPSQYSFLITKAEMYTWEELEKPIMAVLKEEFPDAPSQAPPAEQS